MCLTALFALSISGVDYAGNILNSVVSHTYDDYLFETLLFVLIGICIDISKYIFWAESYRGRYYRLIGLLLMMLSWLASVSFFLAAETTSLQKENFGSIEYQTAAIQITSLKKELLAHERIVEKRLASQYHSQWRLGEQGLKQTSSLRLKIQDLEHELKLLSESREITTSAMHYFFIAVADVLHVSDGMVRWVSFGLLALLLEVCTLASISLVNAYRVDGVGIKQANDFEQVFQGFTVDERELVRVLIQDIRSGKVDPVIRRIRASHYGLGLPAIKLLLSRLLDLGIIEKHKRNSYRLV